MLGSTVDTNMIHRGGFEGQHQAAEEVRKLLESEPFPGYDTLKALDARFIRENLSPGGTADLLAMVYLLHFLKEEAHE